MNTNTLTKWKDSGLLRERKAATRKKNQANKIYINNKEYLDFSHNDYLGLKWRSNQINSSISTGFGSTSSALVTGYSSAHKALEDSFAKWLGFDRGILFNSGYLANIGVIRSLAGRSDTIFSDKLCHASILDGIQLSKAKHYRYKHVDIDHLELLTDSHKPDYIVTESIFSMEGDIAPINKLVKKCDALQAGLIIDDAHGIGALGKAGRGACELFNINQNSIDCLVLPLGKAFNALGAIVLGRNKIIERMLQFAPTYRYTTALPESYCDVAQDTLETIQAEGWRRQKLKENIKFFISYAHSQHLNLISEDLTPIKSILIGSIKNGSALKEHLLAKGYYTALIRPPTVRIGTTRLRISINSLHTLSQIKGLIDCIKIGISKCLI